jgi:hypothetical protein
VAPTHPEHSDSPITPVGRAGPVSEEHRCAQPVGGYIAVAAVLGLVNAFIRPIVRLFTIPITSNG